MQTEAWVWTGFLIGILGSLHCVGMCGPLVLLAHSGTLPESRGSWSWHTTLYHSGRTLAYAVMAAILGLLVDAATLPEWLGPLSMVAGILLIGAYFWGKIPHLPHLGFLWAPMKRLMTQGKAYSLFLAGFLNGWLPCGLSFSAMIMAASMASAWNAAAFMVLFGLGTSPGLLALVWAGQRWTGERKPWMRNLSSMALLLMGLLLLLRGANLGIPLLSPKWEQVKAMAEKPASSPRPSCCHP